MRGFIMPLIDLLFDALDGGVSQEALINAIKREMTEIARADMKRELAGEDVPPSTEPERK